jgi:amidase
LLLADDAFGLAEPAAAAMLHDAANALGVAGEVQVFAGRPSDFLEAYAALQGLDIAYALADFLDGGPRFGPTIQPRFDGVRALDPSAAPRWKAWRREMTARLRTLLPPGTLLLLPSAPSVAPLRFLRDAAAGRFYEAALTLEAVASLAGLPAISLPLATLDGCPLGLCALARPGEDEALLAWTGLARGGS